MKRYDKYKPSGVDWIGDIPEGWEVKRGKFVTKLICGFPFDSKKFSYEESNMPLIRIRDISNTTTESYYSGDYPEESVVKNGELLIGMDGDFNLARWQGKEALLNQRVCKLVSTKQLDEKYAYYLLERPLKCINDVTYATTVKHLSTFDIYEASLPIPPLSEQIAIAIFLDAKCAEIDKVVATQQRRIALLQELKQATVTQAVTRGLDPNAKMKDSGVEWIGEVPEGWKIEKIKYVVKQIGDVDHYMPASVENVVGVPYVMTGDLCEYASQIDFDSCKQISKEDYLILSQKIKAEMGDIIFARYATIGTTCYVDCNEEFVVSYSCVIIKPCMDKVNGRFLVHYMKSNAFKEEVQSYVNSNTQGNVGIESLNMTKIAVPSLPEQTAIANYLDAKCAEIDKQMEAVGKQIELLREYKQALITEVVTGKRKVC